MAKLHSILKNLWWAVYVIWILTIVVIGIFVFSTMAHAQTTTPFDDRWTAGTAPVLTTPNVVTIAPQIAINPQITITPNIIVNPPTITVTGGGATPAVPPKTTVAPAATPTPTPKTLYVPPRPRAPPRIYVRRYIYDDDYRPMTDLTVPADRVNMSNRPGCNGVACYP